MPIKKKNGKWYWGNQGPFDTKNKAEEVAGAAHASGYEKKWFNALKEDEESFDERPKAIEHKGWDTVIQNSTVMQLAEKVAMGGKAIPHLVFEIANVMSQAVVGGVSDDQQGEALNKLVEKLSKVTSDAYEEARQAWLRLDPDLKEEISGEEIAYDPDTIFIDSPELAEIFKAIQESLSDEIESSKRDMLEAIEEIIGKEYDPELARMVSSELERILPHLYFHSLFAVQTRLEGELKPLMEEEAFGEPDVGEIQVDNLPVGQFRDVEDFPETFQEEQKGNIDRWWGIVKGD